MPNQKSFIQYLSSVIAKYLSSRYGRDVQVFGTLGCLGGRESFSLLNPPCFPPALLPPRNAQHSRRTGQALSIQATDIARVAGLAFCSRERRAKLCSPRRCGSSSAAGAVGWLAASGSTRDQDRLLSARPVQTIQQGRTCPGTSTHSNSFTRNTFMLC